MPLDTQIRRAYEEGASVEEIAKQFDCHPSAVKAALSEVSEFTDDDARAVAGVIKNIALSGENERNRLTAAMYVYDVKKGYRINKQDTPTVTAVQINQLINAANLDIKKLLGSPGGDRESQSYTIQAEHCRPEPPQSAGSDGGQEISGTSPSGTPQRTGIPEPAASHQTASQAA